MRTKEQEPEQEGDVLGISQAKGKIPHDNIGKGGHPEGIELDTESKVATPSRNLKRGSGATSIDMGGGGEGNDLNTKH
jgi:hypothetical protein